MILKPPKGAMLNRGHNFARGLLVGLLINEGGGDTIYDLSGNGNEAALTSTAAWKPGYAGPGFYVTGAVGSHVEVQHVPKMLFNDFSVVVRIKRVAWADSYARIVEKRYTHSFAITRAAATNALSFYILGAALTTTATVPQDEWITIACVRQGAVGYIYFDGVLVKSGAVSANILAGLAHIRFGELYSGGNDTFAGTYDYCYIWDRALTAGEIMGLYIDPFNMFRQDPIEIWASATSSVVPAGNAGIMTTNSGFWGITY